MKKAINQEKVLRILFKKNSIFFSKKVSNIKDLLYISTMGKRFYYISNAPDHLLKTFPLKLMKAYLNELSVAETFLSNGESNNFSFNEKSKDFKDLKSNSEVLKNFIESPDCLNLYNSYKNLIYTFNKKKFISHKKNLKLDLKKEKNLIKRLFIKKNINSLKKEILKNDKLIDKNNKTEIDNF